ncbi:MAG TPA: glycosyl hydrolase family 18 protein [Cytophagaceae bacterium]|nr:glycosyl hydrolase family 18 protein [Cytophagaceae bacterium]
MKKHFSYLCILLFIGFLNGSETVQAQLPCKVLVGYLQTSWGTDIRLKDVNSNYNVICLAFFEAGGLDGNPTDNVVDSLSFYSRENAYLLADIPVVQAQGRRVLMSIGGSDGSFKLNNSTDVNTFVSKTKAIIQTYGLDGIDIDLEQQTYLNQTGTISNPSTHIANLISGLQQLLAWYQTTYSKKMILTLVPETAYVTGGLSSYEASTYGVPYLAVIEALRNDIDLLMVQLYNAGSQVGLDNVSYNQGTIDFVLSQTEAIIYGFTCKSAKGVYKGMPASKVVVMLPADPAGQGYVTSSDLQLAIPYLTGQTTNQPGAYALGNSYPDLRGMGAWSINIDNDNGYGFATTYASLFNCTATATENAQQVNNALNVYPNPAKGTVTIEKSTEATQHVQIVNTFGEVIKEQEMTDTQMTIDISNYPAGLYMIKIGEATQKLVIE